MTTIVIFGVLALFAFYIVSIYNSLVTLRNKYKNAFSGIDVQLQRRYDLIPNLVETAKGYMKHEQETLEGVILARNQAITARGPAATNPGDPGAMKKLGIAETMLNGALGKFFALAEAYPDLKANTAMQDLMGELKNTEDQLAFARKNYNETATEFNTATEVFPQNIVANNFKFTRAELLTVTEEAVKEAPKVQF